MIKKKSGFTLIELLIVVAIIAILAAIAVPNFLEAQTRAKVSRVRSDLRTLATGIEAYAVDYNNPPPEARGGSGPFAARTIDGFTGQTGILSVALSTPVAYLTNSDLRDVFYQGAGSSLVVRPDVILFTYKAYPWEWSKRQPGPAVADSAGLTFGEGNALNGVRFKELYGNWRLFSVGPDRDWDNNPTNAKGAFANPCSAGLPYDPTNGTVSIGSLLRSQSQSEQKTWQMVAGQ